MLLSAHGGPAGGERLGGPSRCGSDSTSPHLGPTRLSRVGGSREVPARGLGGTRHSDVRPLPARGANGTPGRVGRFLITCRFRACPRGPVGSPCFLLW